MPKQWSEIAGTEAFQALPDEDKDVVRESYFEKVVEPAVAPEHLEATRDRFYRASGYRSRTLPAGVPESTAGAGRGAGPTEEQQLEQQLAPPARESGSAVPGPAPAAPRRGTMRGVQPFVGGDQRAVEPKPAPVTVLDRLPDAPQTSAYPPSALDVAAGMTVNPAAEQDVRRRLMDSGAIADPRDRETIRPSDPEVQAAGALRAGLKSAGLGSGGQAVVQGVVGGLTDIAKSGTGAATAAADLVGADQASEFFQGATRLGSGFQKAVMPAGGVDQHIANIFSSVTSSIPFMVTGTAAENAAFKLMFAQTGLNDYGERRAQGVAPLPAAVTAGVSGAAEVLGEKFGFHEQTVAVKSLMTRMLEAGASTDDMVKNAAKLLVKEVPGEQLTTAIQFLNEKYNIGGQAPQSTLEDYLGQVADTLITTVGQSALVGGAPLAKDLKKNTIGAADRGIKRSTGELPRLQDPYQEAADKGFVVDPPLTTDPAKTQRSKTVAAFDSVAASYGIPSAAVARAKEAADGMPLEDVGPFFSRFVQALQKRGGVVKPVDPHAIAVLEAGSIEPPPEEGGTEEAKTETAAAPAAAEEDYTGLSEVAPIDKAAHAAATSPQNDLVEPTDAQKEAGNYKLGHHKIAGLDVSIENPQGSVRRARADAPVQWETTMQHHYGYIRGTVGQDGDHIDTFIKPGTPDDFSGKVFVVDQLTRDGKPDEHKVMLGFDTEEEARQAYLSNYEKGWQGLGAITETSVDDFKSWLRDGDTTKPFAAPATEQEAQGGPSQPDVQPAAGVAEAPVPAGGDQPARGGRAVGPDAAAARGERGGPARAPVSGRQPAVAVPDAGRGAAAVAAPASAPASTAGARVIGTAGPMPNRATPIELRPNSDGTLTPWHEGHELLDFETAEPIRLPASTTDQAAVDAVKSAGALGRRTKFFPAKVDSQTASETGEKPEVARPGRSAAASRTARRRIAFKPETDSVLQALAKMGGLKREDVKREFGLRPEELVHAVNAGNLRGFPFRANGRMSIDDAITRLREAGYFAGVSEDQLRHTLETAIHDELGGGRTLSVEGQMAEAQRLTEEEAADRQELMDEAGLSEQELAALTDDDIDLAPTGNASLESFLKALGFNEQEIADETANQAAAAQAGTGQDRTAAGEAARGPAGSGSAETGPAAAAGREGKRAARGLSDEEAFAQDYAAFDGRIVEQQVTVADTGQTFQLRLDAARALRELDARQQALVKLKDCLGGKRA